MAYYNKKRNGIETDSWLFDVTLFGKRYRKTFKLPKSAVKQVYRKWEKDIIDSNGSIGISNHKLFDTLNSFLEYAKETKHSENLKRYQFSGKKLKECFNDMNINDFQEHHIDDYVVWRRKRTFSNQSVISSNATINRDVARISNFFNYCIKRKFYVGVNPTRFWKKLSEEKRKVRLTSEQVDELIEKSNNHIRTAVCLALFCGLRRGEICRLRWLNINHKNKTIELPANITKNRKYRVVKLVPAMVDYLTTLKQNSNSDYVLTFRNKPIGDFKKTWEKIRNVLTFKILPDGKIIHFHDLRHVFGQSLKDSGVPMADIQSLMGHHSVTTTEKYYANMDSIYLEEQVNKLTQMFSVLQSGIVQSNS